MPDDIESLDIADTGAVVEVLPAVQPRRHAPKGRIIKRDLEGEQHPMGRPNAQRCTAKSKTSGKQCGQAAIPGATVCHYHGGAAPQVKRKAMERLMELQHPAINRLEQLIEQEQFPTVAYAASRDVLDRTLGKAAEQQQVQHSGTIRVIHELPE